MLTILNMSEHAKKQRDEIATKSTKIFQNCEPDGDDKAIPWTAVLTLAVKKAKYTHFFLKLHHVSSNQVITVKACIVSLYMI